MDRFCRCVPRKWSAGVVRLFLFILCGTLLLSRGEISPELSTVPSLPSNTKPQTSHLDGGPQTPPMIVANYHRIQIPFEITLWVLLASISKIGFHMYHKITIWIPVSCLLISVGLIVGAIIHGMHEEPPAALSYTVFFLYMLPPIMLDSGYFMPTKAFFQNVGTVLWFAVVGTMWNAAGIGLSLFGICQIKALGLEDISLRENLLFGSILAAVDPVAVLSVFEDVNVNEQLYIVVFGECLFNDAVIVVLYNMFTTVTESLELESVGLVLSVFSFFMVGLVGLLLGILFGFVAAFSTRFTTKVREIEPLLVFLYSYLAYLLAELLSVSSITAVVTCALTMKYYVEENVAQRSSTTIRHVIKTLATVSETLIFFFLGVVTVTTHHEWNWGYVLFTLLFAFVWRVLGVLILAQIINHFRTIPFNFKEQFIMAYSGIRGAVSFALVFLLPHTIARRNLFLTTTITVIMFTCFIQGISVRPLIEFMNVKKVFWKCETINAEIHVRAMEHTIVGIEDICGQWSHYYWKDKFKKLNDKFLRKILVRDNRAESSIVALYKKLELQNAMEILDSSVSGGTSPAPSTIILHGEKKPPSSPEASTSDLKSIHNILSKNLYNTQRTVAYTNRHTLPNDTKAKEILIRRHASIRRSLRSGSFREESVQRPMRWLSLPPSRMPLRRRHHARSGGVDGASEVEMDSPPLSHRSSRAKTPPRTFEDLRETSIGGRSVQPLLVDIVDEQGERSRPSSSVSDPRTRPTQRLSPQRQDGSLDNSHQNPEAFRKADETSGQRQNVSLRRPLWKPQSRSDS